MPVFYCAIAYAGLKTLVLSTAVDKVLRIAITLAITYFIIRAISAALGQGLRRYLRKQERGEEKVKQIGGLMLLVNMVLWMIGALFISDNLGYDVTAIVAGLGIGGIAVALAAQNILGDLFNYFVIFFDRPFEVGDFIVVDEKSGTIEDIGIKTTRVRALSGEEIIFANSDLTGSRIHNYKRMKERRVEFVLHIGYDVALEQLRSLPGVVREVIEGQSKVTFDHANLTGFQEYSLDLEVVYKVQSPDYNVYRSIHEQVNLALFERLGAMGVRMGHPIRTLQVLDRKKELPNVPVGKQERVHPASMH